jgi:F420-dependent hydroxymycolic acid dehydrogenase
LYDPPAQPIPIYIAAAGERSMAIAAQHGDGLVADVAEGSVRDEFEAELRKANRNPAGIPIMSEMFTVVGDRKEAEAGAELWRFQPSSWKKHMLYDPDPRSIQRKAQDNSLESVYKDWPIGTDPEVHVQGIRKLVEAGATIVNVHSVQPDQHRAIEFYGKEVLPRIR